MITEDYVSYEVAKLLKEKGFDEYCYKFYDYNSKEIYKETLHCCNSRSDDYSAPTLQMAMKWLREVHNIFIEIGVSIDLNGDYHFGYTILDKECKYVRRGYTFFDWSYEDAVEAALEYCLEILI